MLPRFDICVALSFEEAASQFDKRVHVSLLNASCCKLRRLTSLPSSLNTPPAYYTMRRQTPHISEMACLAVSYALATSLLGGARA